MTIKAYRRETPPTSSEPFNGILKPYNFSLHWRDGGNNTYRVWRYDWAGDQFEVLTPEQFAELKATEIYLIKHEVEED